METTSDNTEYTIHITFIMNSAMTTTNNEFSLFPNNVKYYLKSFF
jgi:hypothetical protein